MQVSTFWSGQPLIDVTYTTIALGGAMVVAFMLTTPGLTGLVISSYRHSRTEHISNYIARFLPVVLFVGLVVLASSILSVGSILPIIRHLGLIPEDLSLGSAWGLLGLGSLAILVLYLCRMLSFELWGYTFMDGDQRTLLRQDILVIETIRSLTLLPIGIMSVAPIDTQIKIIALSVHFLLIQLLLIVQGIRRLWNSSSSKVYIFLYLCTHEILPWLYIILALRMPHLGLGS